MDQYKMVVFQMITMMKNVWLNTMIIMKLKDVLDVFLDM